MATSLKLVASITTPKKPKPIILASRDGVQREFTSRKAANAWANPPQSR